MKTTPAIFQGWGVRSIMDGSKTQTRRIVNPQPRSISWNRAEERWRALVEPDPVEAWATMTEGVDSEVFLSCPYGQPGDLIWVRETFCVSEKAGRVRYKATDGEALKYENYKPSIHMPRWASRLTLEVADVRVERVQDISGVDACREGVATPSQLNNTLNRASLVPFHEQNNTRARSMFRELWNSINAPRGYGWDANPWVWVIEFRSIRDNVDNVLRHREAT